MSQKRLARHVLLATPTGMRPKGQPRASWSDCISDLAWSRLGVEPAELSEIPENCNVFRVLLWLSPDHPERQHKYKNG